MATERFVEVINQRKEGNMKLSILMSTLISLVLALIVSSAVHAQTKEIAPFVGIWSNTQEGCKKLINGELDKMDTVHSTYFESSKSLPSGSTTYTALEGLLDALSGWSRSRRKENASSHRSSARAEARMKKAHPT